MWSSGRILKRRDNLKHEKPDEPQAPLFKHKLRLWTIAFAALPNSLPKPAGTVSLPVQEFCTGTW